ncbi:AzlC family ABC transporter permease [Fructilactobacillus sanfranciscensis]|uniref:AzlC family ABC transporter permease n=1 Tax=Fructilactobacillus sanfranciscensis TaxID=1625 RepID=UPI000CD42DCD|nr:AzlC family ABC transporter permease [Fructilactobacillus sanfranciscensis]NDR60813.1 branched-chain amino acid ABC transporter permease [Fructilactobacillus sanfranciscensis]NDR70240.1 branched-chain amino acid ABC transporter permease [Fructilactobacillus sanfranciscensis]NDS16881.1 branched-chain amino acid ABC transporter permease [Fructilactobacillus sanfranciscensis]POH19684.1 azaleucine resistance protein AzlC [Fructilactobacillus sanfranciscensis]
MNGNLSLRSGIKDTIPTLSGYIGVGLTFGIVAKSAGLNLLIIVLMSAITYSGAAQFVIVSMLVSGSTFLSILVAVFLLSSRMLLMGMTVAPYLKKESMKRNIILGSLLTDETFALTMNKLNYTKRIVNFEWLNTANILAYLTWIIASGIGGSLGSLIPNPNKFGLDFAFIAMFIGLLYLQILADRTMAFKLQVIMVLVTLGLTYLGLIFIPSSLLLLVVTLVGCWLGVKIKNAFF